MRLSHSCSQRFLFEMFHATARARSSCTEKELASGPPPAWTEGKEEEGTERRCGAGLGGWGAPNFLAHWLLSGSSRYEGLAPSSHKIPFIVPVLPARGPSRSHTNQAVASLSVPGASRRFTAEEQDKVSRWRQLGDGRRIGRVTSER